jgi:hypothetical protein
VHGLQVARDERALAARGAWSAHAGGAGQCEDLQRREVEVGARREDVGAVQPAGGVVSDHRGLRYDERERDRPGEQVVGHGRVDVYAAQQVAQLALADQPTERVVADAGGPGLGGGEGAVVREP